MKPKELIEQSKGKKKKADWTCDIPGCGKKARQTSIFCKEHTESAKLKDK